jgi:hypothetical protein
MRARRCGRWLQTGVVAARGDPRAEARTPGPAVCSRSRGPVMGAHGGPFPSFSRHVLFLMDLRRLVSAFSVRAPSVSDGGAWRSVRTRRCGPSALRLAPTPASSHHAPADTCNLSRRSVRMCSARLPVRQLMHPQPARAPTLHRKDAPTLHRVRRARADKASLSPGARSRSCRRGSYRSWLDAAAGLAGGVRSAQLPLGEPEAPHLSIHRPTRPHDRKGSARNGA